MTVQNVFDIAIRLMDEQNESTGGTDTVDTKEYALRTPSLLNSVLDEVYRYSTDCVPESGKPVEYPYDISSMNDEIHMDKRLVRGVLPYLLASLLYSEEDNDMAQYFKKLYDLHLSEVAQSFPAESESVTDLYGGIECGEFGAW